MCKCNNGSHTKLVALTFKTVAATTTWRPLTNRTLRTAQFAVWHGSEMKRKIMLSLNGCELWHCQRFTVFSCSRSRSIAPPLSCVCKACGFSVAPLFNKNYGKKAHIFSIDPMSTFSRMQLCRCIDFSHVCMPYLSHAAFSYSNPSCHCGCYRFTLSARPFQPLSCELLAISANFG